jgi:hypothetical protein
MDTLSASRQQGGAVVHILFVEQRASTTAFPSCTYWIETVRAPRRWVRYFAFFDGLWPLSSTLPVVVSDTEPERYVALPVLLSL